MTTPRSRRPPSRERGQITGPVGAPADAPTTAEDTRHGRWPTDRRSFDAMSVDVRVRLGWGKLATRAGTEVATDTILVVYTATDPATAARLLADGLDERLKPGNLARTRYEAGEPAEFAPGRGLDAGLYVGPTPGDVDGYGPVTLAVRVRAGDLRPSAEQVALSSSRVPANPFEALRVVDAVVDGPIAAERIAQVGAPRSFVRDAFAELRLEGRAAPAP
jgi:hypothetical protein